MLPLAHPVIAPDSRIAVSLEDACGIETWITTLPVLQSGLKEIRSWPPGLPIFGLMTPLPATPLYKRLESAGGLTRPKHWQEFIPFAMAHTPLKMSIDEAQNEVRIGWASSYSPDAIAKAVDALNHEPLGYRINILIARLCFRGIYFPQMRRLAWLQTIVENRRTILKLVKQGFGAGAALHAPAPAAPTRLRLRSTSSDGRTIGLNLF